MAWQISFNVEKCKLIHYGYNNVLIEYQVYDVPLDSFTEEKIHGASIKRNLKKDRHISSCVVKANKILTMIKRTFSTRRGEVLLKLYKYLV